MARTELPNGVILPAEYSDDWYEDMTSNLTKLDDVIGSDSEKLNADGVYFLRMSSAALTDSGTGNFSDLNSSYKIKTGDLVLDSGRKLYRIVSVDSTNSTFSVGNSLFKVTAESDLAPVAESGDYDDLDNKPDLKPVATSGDYDDLTDLPTYGITRLCSSAITDNSTVAFSAISSTDKIKAGDFLLNTNGKLYQISSVDTANETVSVTTPLTVLALDANVMHLSGNETVAGIKTFSDIPIFATFDGIRFRCAHNSGAYVTFRNTNQANPGSIIFSANDGNVSTAFHLVDKTLIPYTNGDIDLGTSLRKWKSLNGINPGSLSLPDLDNGLDISGYITVNSGNKESLYTPPVNGWISVRLSRTSGSVAVSLIQGGMASSGRDITIESGVKTADAMLPVNGGVQVSINSALADRVVSAYFYPCQGNV